MTRLLITLDGLAYEVELDAVSGDTCRVMVNGEELSVTVPQTDATVIDVEWLIVNGWPYEVAFDANLQWLKAYDGLHLSLIHILRPGGGVLWPQHPPGSGRDGAGDVLV